MDSDFMNNLNNMLNSGKLPDNIKDLLNNFKNNNVNDCSNSDNSNNFNNNETTSNNSNGNNNSGSTNTINPDMLKNIINMLNNSNSSNSSNSNNSNFNVSSDDSSSIDSGGNSSVNGFGNIDMNMILKMKMIMDKMKDNKNDPRANLLLSLKPYLKESRKNKVEQYVQLFSMSKIMEVFNQNGGENTR